jgi:hypothetical protein
MPEFQVSEGGKVKARVRQAGVKIHGPNSPDVITGKVPLGFRETVDFGENGEQLVELDRAAFAQMFGEDEANRVFEGVNDGSS